MNSDDGFSSRAPAGFVLGFVLASVCGLCASGLLLVYVLKLCNAGFDFTDEGFYLNWISDPWSYQRFVSQFGYVYHPLYSLLGGDIAGVRRANILITFGLGLLLSAVTIFGQQRRPLGAAELFGALCACVMLATCSLTIFEMWLPTPSYNSLNFQAITLAGAAMLLVARNERLMATATASSLIMMITGNVLALLAKPTSGVALTLTGVAAICLLRRNHRAAASAIVVAATVAAIVGWAITIDGSLAVFIDRMAGAEELVMRLHAGRHLLMILPWPHRAMTNLQFVALVVTVGVAIQWTGVGKLISRFGSSLVLFVASAISVALIIGVDWLAPVSAIFHPAQFVSLVIGLARSQGWPGDPLRQPPRRVRVVALILAGLPAVYAVGATLVFWPSLMRAGFFWLQSAVVINARANAVSWSSTLAAAALVITTGTLMSSTNKPERQVQALRLQAVDTEVGPAGSILRLSDSANHYIDGFRALAVRNGLLPGHSIIDLSGVSPGLAFALGLRQPGVAWAIAGYAGSTDSLIGALDREDCRTIATSWLLTEPNSPLSHRLEILKRYGIDPQSDYVNAGSQTSRRAIGPFEFEQHLLKPARSEAEGVEACNKARATKSTR